jgi:hypothetical protein
MCGLNNYSKKLNIKSMSQPPQQPLFPGPDDGRASFTERPPALDRRSVQESMAEAAARPLEYDPATRATYIRDNVTNIKRMIDSDKTEAEIRALHGDFALSHPELFKKLLAGEDLSQLHSMLHMLDQMGRGNLSQHQASMIVGTRLAERFLPEQFRPSQQQRNSNPRNQ